MRLRLRVATTIAASLLVSGVAGAQSFQLLEATIDDVHAALTSGQITCRGLVQRYLDRIEAYDDAGPALNTIQFVNPGALREAVRECARLFEDPVFQGVIDSRIAPTADEISSDELLDAWIAATVSIAGHTCRTCKMGPKSDPEAVVDQFCQVRGVEGLWVIDASVMPEIPRANTNATVIMIAERVADLIVR